MSTDNWPQEFVYFSRRMLLALSQQHDAGGKAWRVEKLRPSVPGLGAAELSREDTAAGNPYTMAKLVTNAVRDSTGTVTDPGDYVRLTAKFTYSPVNVLQGQYSAAWFEADVPDEAGDEVRVCLCGSIKNFVDMAEGEDQRLRSYPYPSSVAGLDTLFAAFSKTEDPLLEPAPAVGDSVLAAQSVQHVHGRLVQKNMGIAVLDVLFKRFYDFRYEPKDGVAFKRLMLGTPLWAATPAPEAESSLLLDLERVKATSSGTPAVSRPRLLARLRGGRPSQRG